MLVCVLVCVWVGLCVWLGCVCMASLGSSRLSNVRPVVPLW